MRKIMIASLWGSVLELYDFTLMGALAPVIAGHFFINNSPMMEILKYFLVFAVGFCARPLGSLFFGSYGDRNSRLDALTLSLSISSLATLGIGLLPSVNQIGVGAVVLLVILRLAQGVGISGEHAGAMTVLYESKTVNSNFKVSMGMYGIMFGMMLAFVVLSMMYSIFGSQAVHDWAWRIPFVLGGVVGLIGVIFRRFALPNHTSGIKKHEISKSPIRELFRENIKQLLLAIGVYWLCAVLFYATYFYLPVEVLARFPHEQVTISNIKSVNMVIYMFMLVGFGVLTNYVEVQKLLKIAAIAALVLIVPMFYFSLQSIEGFFICQLILTAINSSYLAPFGIALARIFKSSIRYSGMSVTINATVAIFGGTAPAVMILLSMHFGTILSSLYLVVAACVSLMCINTRLFSLLSGTDIFYERTSQVQKQTPSSTPKTFLP